jgi:hypothetical protein
MTETNLAPNARRTRGASTATVEASRSWCPGLEVLYVPNSGPFVP